MNVTSAKKIEVWDLFVRIFHWTVLAAVILNLFVFKEDIWRQATGYIAGAAVILRIVWGFIGTKYARFSQFFPSPRQLREQIHAEVNKKSRRYIGHTPFGSLMMLTLMGLLLAVAVTGWFMTQEFSWAPGWLEDVHGLLAESIMWLAFFHALAAIVESYRHRENLVKSMITGKKRAEEP
ncbi:cytochrome b/b6 domain-containing protein [Rhizobium metallidurans]|uniref:Cytochrome b n=1 Tax=Rhizobium metallidurans TaxID=1265931 RepID=A0A7W6CTV0_9HYPH|nr:cytochrome b/b6 domain-containing protein [Rhizobium metallidurans]MBB3967018.1 cytochrome b [Rhizobium metallidurans]